MTNAQKRAAREKYLVVLYDPKRDVLGKFGTLELAELHADNWRRHHPGADVRVEIRK